MEKKITITLPDEKARILMDIVYSQMHLLDFLHSNSKRATTKNSADVAEEVFEDLRRKIYS